MCDKARVSEAWRFSEGNTIPRLVSAAGAGREEHCSTCQPLCRSRFGQASWPWRSCIAVGRSSVSDEASPTNPRAIDMASNAVSRTRVGHEREPAEPRDTASATRAPFDIAGIARRDSRLIRRTLPTDSARPRPRSDGSGAQAAPFPEGSTALGPTTPPPATSAETDRPDLKAQRGWNAHAKRAPGSYADRFAPYDTDVIHEGAAPPPQGRGFAGRRHSTHTRGVRT